MKRIGLLCFAPIMFLFSCGNSAGNNAIYKNFLNKTYETRGFICRFYEDKILYVDEYSRFSCFYEKTKLEKEVTKNDYYPDITIETNKEYVFVYVQGIDSSYPMKYKFLGLFSNDNTFVTISINNYQLSINDVFTAK